MAKSASNVKQLRNDDEVQKEMALSGDKLVVVKFFAQWCGTCKRISPKFDEFSVKFRGPLYFKIDIDACTNASKRYEVQVMPTFIFFHKQQKIDQLKGSNELALESMIIKYTEQTGCGIPEDEGNKDLEILTIPGQEYLNTLVSVTGSECLNESDENTFMDALDTKATYLESDCDEQLVIGLAFTQSVRLHSLRLVAPQDGRAPRTVRLFINQTHTLDFDSAESRNPIQELVLCEDDVSAESVIPLSYLKFQNVHHLTLFIKDNQGGADTTVINHIGLYGSLRDTTNMKDFKRVAGEKGERH